MKNRFTTGVGIISVLFSIGATAYAFVQTRRTSNVAKKLDLTLDNVSSRTPVRLEEDVMHKAVQKAVDREVREAIRDTTKEIKTSMRDDMDREIRSNVSEAYDDIQKKMMDRVDREVSDKDIEKMKSDIMAKVGSRVVQDFFGITGLGKSFSNHGWDIGGIKELISALPEWERSEALENFFKYRNRD